MAFAPVDINSIQLDKAPLDTSTPAGKNAAVLDLFDPQQASGYKPIDISKIQLDAPSAAASQDQPSTLQELGRQTGRAGRDIAVSAAGLLDLPTMLMQGGAGASAGLMNALVGSNVSNQDIQNALPLPSQGMADLIDSTTNNRFQPQNGLERITSGMGQALTGTGASIASAASKVPQLAQLANKAALQARAALGSSFAAGTTKEAGGGPLLQTLAGIAGGGAASMGGTKKPAQITSDDIKARANVAYQEADAKGGTLSPSFTDNFINEAEKAAPQTEAGKMMFGDSPVSKMIEKMQSLRGKKLSLAEAQEIDEGLGDAIDSYVDNGIVHKQGKKLLDVQTKFRNSIEGAAEGDIVGGKEGFDAWKNGKQLWAQHARLRDVEKIIARAETSDNPAQTIKSGFRTMLNNPNRIRGFSKQEQAAIKKAATSGVVGDTLNTMGSRLIPIIAASTGFGGLAGGLGATAAAQAASLGSRGAAARLQTQRAAGLSALIAGTPKPNQMPANLAKALGMTQGIIQAGNQ